MEALGASSYTYTEATWSQDLANWTGSHIRAFAFFGGVPEIVVPDNLRSGVSRACRYEPDLNRTYQEMTAHYGVAVVPARRSAFQSLKQTSRRSLRRHFAKHLAHATEPAPWRLPSLTQTRLLGFFVHTVPLDIGSVEDREFRVISRGGQHSKLRVRSRLAKILDQSESEHLGTPVFTTRKNRCQIDDDMSQLFGNGIIHRSNGCGGAARPASKLRSPRTKAGTASWVDKQHFDGAANLNHVPLLSPREARRLLE